VDPLALAALVVGVLAVALAIGPFGAWALDVLRWWRRRDPLTLEVRPHPHRPDALFVSIATRSTERLPLAVLAFRATDGTEAWGPQVQNETVDPNDDEVVVLVDAAMLPPLGGGAVWASVWVKDRDDHEQRVPIPPGLAARIGRTS